MMWERRKTAGSRHRRHLALMGLGSSDRLFVFGAVRFRGDRPSFPRLLRIAMPFWSRPLEQDATTLRREIETIEFPPQVGREDLDQPKGIVSRSLPDRRYRCSRSLLAAGSGSSRTDPLSSGWPSPLQQEPRQRVPSFLRMIALSICSIARWASTAAES